MDSMGPVNTQRLLWLCLAAGAKDISACMRHTELTGRTSMDVCSTGLRHGIILCPSMPSKHGILARAEIPATAISQQPSPQRSELDARCMHAEMHL